VKTGRTPHKHDPNVHRFRATLAAAGVSLQGRPAALQNGAGLVLGYFCNDRLGCCTIATFAILLAVWTNVVRVSPVLVADADVEAAYAAAAGWRADDPSTDQGAEEPTIVAFLQKTGVAGHTIDAHGWIPPDDQEAIEGAIWLCGGVSLDLELPATAKTQLDAGAPWDVVGDPTDEASPAARNSWPGGGGHEAAGVGYDAGGMFIRTWGRVVYATWPWVRAYCLGAWAFRSCDWVRDDGKTGAGLDVSTWETDLAKIARPDP
jgi:hypothetical protein